MVVIASALGYWFGKSHMPQIVKENVTVYGEVAKRAGDSSYLLQTNGLNLRNVSLQVKLIKYEGNYYYLSNFTYWHNGEETKYTVWVDNSTYYCATPKVRDIPTCP